MKCNSILELTQARLDQQEEILWIAAKGFSTGKMTSCANSATALKANIIIDHS